MATRNPCSNLQWGCNRKRSCRSDVEKHFTLSQSSSKIAVL